MVVEIDATTGGRQPDYALIENLAAECRMPLCYGGGVRSAAEVERIVALGVEKVALSSALFEDPQIISIAAECVGNQSIVAVFDVKKVSGNRYEIFTHNGTRATGRSPEEMAVEMERLGAGEIVLNSIDQDGKMKGYDLRLVEQVKRAVNVPITCLGGAGSLQDMRQLIEQEGAIGAAAGSLFVFKGVFRAVLINYPNRAVKDALVIAAQQNRVGRG